jgi:hypothetical protein
MTRWTIAGGATAFLLGSTCLAQADVTGAEVWNNWRSAAEGMGQVLTPGAETQSGDTLTISDLKISMSAPEVDVTGTIAQVEFRDRGDGTVEVTFSPSYRMMIDARPPDAETAEVVIDINQTGLTMVASGGDGEIAYDFLAPQVQIDLVSVVADGKPIDVAATATLAGMNGNYTVTEGDVPIVSSRLNAESLDIDVASTEPDNGGGNMTMTFSVADITSESSASLTPMVASDNLSEMLAAGFGAAGTFQHGASSYKVDFVDGSDMFKLDGSADAGSVGFVVDDKELGYDISNSGLSIVFSGSDIPLPEVAFSLAEIGFGFLMPTAVDAQPSAFEFGVTLAELSVSDMIWSMVDMTGALPHDPATLIVDVTGSMNWLVDIFDPAVAENMGEEVPAELHDLTLNDLTLGIAGAQLTGTGGFTFDNTDLETFDGLPAPTGSIDLKLVGANTLLDALVAMGIVPEDQAMGARMMMGLFARPGDGVDTLVSKIEVDGATGAISANGQRLQ